MVEQPLHIWYSFFLSVLWFFKLHYYFHSFRYLNFVYFLYTWMYNVLIINIIQKCIINHKSDWKLFVSIRDCNKTWPCSTWKQIIFHQIDEFENKNSVSLIYNPFRRIMVAILFSTSGMDEASIYSIGD